MTNETKFEDIDFDNLDAFDGSDDLFGDEPDLGKERTPLGKITIGAVKRFKSQDSNMGLAGNLAKKALPVGYSSAWDVASKVKSDASRIYDKSVRDLEGSKRILKKIGSSALPMVDKILPDSIVKKLEEITEDNGTDDYRNNLSPDESEITNVLSTIFDANKIIDFKNKSEESIRSEMADNKDDYQFAVTETAQDRISLGISKLVGYQDTVLSQYHRKSLELQHRHYFTARDLLEFTKSSNDEISGRLDGILKNTGLPNEIKLRNSEKFAALNQELLLGKVQESVSSRLSGLPGKIREGMQQKAAEIVESVSGNLEMLEGAIPDPSGDTLDTIGGELGRFGGNKVTDKLGKYIAGKINDDGLVARLGKDLTLKTQNSQRIVNDQIKNNPLLEFISELVGGGIYRDGETVTHNLVENAITPVTWDVLSRRTLIEIIPGFLSRQLEQLTNIATGTLNERTVYNVDREEFTSSSTASTDILNKFTNNVDDYLGDKAIALVNKIDPDNKLDPKAKIDLALQLVQDSADGQFFNPLKYTDPTTINSDDSATQISDVVKDFFKVTTDGDFNDVLDTGETTKDRRSDVTNDYNSLGNTYTLNDRILGNANGVGVKEILRNIGAIEKDDSGITDIASVDFKSNIIRENITNALQAESDITPPDDNGPNGPLSSPPMGPNDPRQLTPVSNTPTNIPPTPEVPTITNISNLDVSVDTSSLEERVTAHSDRNINLLTRIADRLDMGLITNTEITPTSESDTTNNITDKYFGKVGAGIAATGNLLGVTGLTAVKRLKSLATPVLGAVPKIVNRTFSSSKDLLKNSYQSIKDKGDLYLDDFKGTPLLSKYKLDAGEYYDVGTNEVIKKWSDIKGAVRDSEGVVLSLEQFGDGNRLLSPKGPIRGVIGGAYDRLKGLRSETFNIVAKIPPLVVTGKNLLLNLVSSPRDIYLKGQMDSPVLFKTGFNRGIYFSQATGKSLQSQIYIDGPVLSEVAGGESYVILSKEQIEQGLVYSDGSIVQFDSPLGLLKTKGLSLLLKGKSIIGNRLSAIRKTVKGVAGSGINLVRNITDGKGVSFEPKTSVDSPTVPIAIKDDRLDYLERIYRFISGKKKDSLASHIRDNVIPFRPIDSVGENKDNVVELDKRVSQISNVIQNTELPDKTKNKIIQLKDSVRSPDFNIESIQNAFRNVPGISGLSPLMAGGGKFNFIPNNPLEFTPTNNTSQLNNTGGVDKSARVNMLTEFKDYFSESKLGDTEIVSSIIKLGDSIRGLIKPDTEKFRESTRTGSFANILRKRKEKDNKESDSVDATESSKRGKGLSLTGGLAGLSKMASLFKRKSNDDNDNGGGGFLDTIKDWAIPAAASAVGAGVTVTGALGGGLAAVGSGAAAVGTGALSLGGSLLGGAGTGAAWLLTNPAGWAVLGTAAAAYGGYKAYKYLARRADLEPIEKLRYMQYGVPTNVSDVVVMMRYLEDEISDNVTVSDNGVPNFDFPDDESVWQRFSSDFGGVTDNPTHKKNFDIWFFFRFLPIYTDYLKQANHFKVDFDDLDDDLDNGDKASFVSNVLTPRRDDSMPDPFSLQQSPWPHLALVDNGDAIKSLADQIMSASYQNLEVNITETISPPVKPKVIDPSLKRDKIVDRSNNPNNSALSKDIDKKEIFRNTTRTNILSTVMPNYKYRETGELVKSKPTNDTMLLMPAEGRLSSPFGTRSHPIKRKKSSHKGIDIAAPSGTPVFAAADGIITRAYRSNSYGNVVYIKHDDGRITRYAHLSRFSPSVSLLGNTRTANMPIGAGEHIGDVGSTGNSTGPHLHFEYRENDGVGNSASVLNPMLYFDKRVTKKVEEENLASITDDVLGSKIETGGLKDKEESILPKPISFESNIVKAAVAPTDKNMVSNINPEFPISENNTLPIIKVDAPDFSGLNDNQMSIAQDASAQRIEQTTLTGETNKLLTDLLEAIRLNGGNVDESIVQVMGNNTNAIKKRAIVNINKTG